MKFSYLKTCRLPSSGVPPAVQCLIWRIIPLCHSCIFVIKHEEWEETSACQHFEERRKETTKGSPASHKGFPICSLQLFLFRELLSQPESGSQSKRWFLCRCWLEANVWQMTLFLLCKNRLTVSAPDSSPPLRCLDLEAIRDKSFREGRGLVGWFWGWVFHSCTTWCVSCLQWGLIHWNKINLHTHYPLFMNRGLCICLHYTLSMHVLTQSVENCVHVSVYKYWAVCALCLLVSWHLPTIISPLFSCICCTGLKTKWV